MSLPAGGGGVAYLVEVYTDLRTDCVRQGHALGQKEHEADRWVAATAIWFEHDHPPTGCGLGVRSC